MDRLELAKLPLKKPIHHDEQISKFISKYKITQSTTKIPNSVIYQLYKHWHYYVGRQAGEKRYSPRQFFRRFKRVFPKCYDSHNVRGYYLNKGAFMPYFEFTGDVIHEQKIKEKGSG